jgi:pimeloyl-ACP methyl ester carboxylesterase
MTDLKLFFTAMGEVQAGISQTDATKSWPSTSSATGKALAAAGVPVRSALLMLGLMAGIPTQSASFDSISGPEGALKLSFPLAVSPALAVLENGANAGALAILALSDVEGQVGGAIFDNTKTDYAARVAESSVIFNAALSGNAAITAMLGALSPANPGAPRAVGNPDAIAKLNALAMTTGKINVPTIFMTGVADPITPAGATQRVINKYVDQYEAEKAAAKQASYGTNSYSPAKSKVLTLWSVTPKSWTKFTDAGSPVAQKGTPGTGHCTFTTANYLTAAKFLTDAGKTGQINFDAAARTAVRKSKGLLVDPNFTAPLLKFYGE